MAGLTPQSLHSRDIYAAAPNIKFLTNREFKDIKRLVLGGTDLKEAIVQVTAERERPKFRAS